MGHLAHTVERCRAEHRKEAVWPFSDSEDPQSRIARHKEEFGKLMPSTREEATREAIRKILQAGGAAAAVGAGLRLLQHVTAARPETEGLQSRVSTIPLGKEAGILDWLSDLKEGTRESVLSALASGTEPSKPRHLPWYLPALMLATPAAGYASYKSVDKLLDATRRREIEAAKDKAKVEYEKALAAEYAGRKSASGDEAVDGLARMYALDKSAFLDGELGTVAGVYTTLALLSALAGHMAGKKFVESRDPVRAKQEALEKAIIARRSALPPIVQVAQ